MRRLAALLLLAGCDSELSFGRLLAEDAGAADAEAADADAADADAADATPTADASTQVSCAPPFPAFTVGDGDPNCGSEGFHHALCSCGDYVSSGTTIVDGFDSRTGAPAPGSLALDGTLSAGDLRISGSLLIAGERGAPLTGPVKVGGSLFSRGPVVGTQPVTVAGDARVAGDVRLDSFRVGGTLHLPDGAALELADGIAPTTLRTPVMVAPPCDCTLKLDVGARIDAARNDNDNASIALDPALGLRSVDGARAEELPCGRYYVEQIYAAQPLTLAVHGRVALFVDQRIVTETTGSLTITLDRDAQLDLFLRLGVTGGGPIELRGGSTRVYVGGNDSLLFGAPTTLEASLYAPNSEFVSQRRFELYGAALLRRAVAEQDMVLHQDVALANGTCSN
ncbi:MAG TPA: polymer-forming cytoskeletal protein [Polyangiales bacterium]